MATKVATWSSLPDRKPVAVEVAGRPLVVVRHGQAVSVLSGLCPHRGGRMADATVEGDRIVCGAHGWDFNLGDGLSPSSPSTTGDSLRCFAAVVDEQADAVLVDEEEVRTWARDNVMPFDPDDLLP